jgi:hypothetical protein
MLAYSGWQKIQQRDREIYDALNVKDSSYGTLEIDLDQHTDFAAAYATYAERHNKVLKKWMWKMQRTTYATEEEKQRDIERAIQEFRQNDGAITEGVAQPGQISIGGGESGETEAES